MYPSLCRYQTSPPAVRAFFDTLNGKWTSGEIAGVLPRRYLLQHTALEVFLRDRTTLFFTFSTPRLAKTARSKIPVPEDYPAFFFGMVSARCVDGHSPALVWSGKRRLHMHATCHCTHLIVGHITICRVCFLREDNALRHSFEVERLDG